MTWDWNFVREIIPALLDGLKITALATVLASALSVILGLFWAIARRSRFKLIRLLVSGFTEFVRRTPLLVQLYFIFFVLPSLGLTLPALVAGVIGLGINYSTYTAELYRAGIESIARGQWEAALVLDLPQPVVWSRIILPQAIPKIIPALGNTVIAMFKETALLSAIGVTELIFVANRIGATTYVYTEPLLVAGAMYFVVSYVSSVLIRATERRVAVSKTS